MSIRFSSVLPTLLLTLLAACGSSGSEDGGGGADVRSDTTASDTLRSRRLPPRGEAWVIFGSDTVRAEIAESPEARERGLMYRRDLPEGTGMLFVFQSEAERSFWMRNTYIPLSIAFLDSGMRIVDIQRMEPEAEEYHDSESPAMFALEVPQGWFEEHGVAEGEQAEIVFGPR